MVDLCLDPFQLILKYHPHQPCEGLIDTTAISTDPQQTFLHPSVMTLILN